MGKVDNQQLPVVQQPHATSRNFFCQRCSMGFYNLFGFKCALVLIFSVAAFLSALFWLIPLRHGQAGFDAEHSIKLNAAVQSYFQLQKPVAELLPYISRLEYDVNEEIGAPFLKVAVLSMHKSHLSNRTSLSNWTDVVLGFLPDPINSTAIPMSLSLLKSSLIDLILHEYNLTLTSSLFGEPSSFEVLKFPGGITIMPERMALSQTLFTFTLNSSISEIKENLLELKGQLKRGLHLMPNEFVYVQLTNKHGSTIDLPVTVEASVASDQGAIQLERLTQLAQTLTGSPPAENLGLDHSVFGKVKGISLSSFLKHSLHPPALTPVPSISPSPSPAPLSKQNSEPSLVPSYSPAFSPNSHHSPPPCPNIFGPDWASPTSAPTPQNVACHSSSPNSGSPALSGAHGSEKCGPTDPPIHPPTSHPDQMSRNLSPHDGLMSPIHVSSSSTYAYSSFTAGVGRVQCFYLNGLATFLLLLGYILLEI